MSDESLFREVDEEVRQEQFKKLWARYGNLVIAVCLAVVIGVAGFKGWQYWQVKQSEAAGESFFSASKLAGNGKSDEALKQFEAIGHSGFGLLADLRQANLLASQGKTAEAVKIYDAVAGNSASEPALRDLAKMRAAITLADTVPPAELSARVQAFDAAGNPWRHAARELMAVSLWKSGDNAGAQKHIDAILGDAESPADYQQRARMLADLVKPALAKK